LIQEYQRQYKQPVLAISERAGISLDSAEMFSVGFEPAYQFDGQGKHVIHNI
jgi:hypothetical protein